MDSQASSLLARRLAAQQLYAPRWPQPERAVETLGGVQAQDPSGAIWSIGLRTCDATAPQVQAAIDDRHIVRTWAFRGTLHYLFATDLPWMLPLLAPAIVARNARRYRQLDLDEATFAQSERVMRRALKGGLSLARSEIARALEAEGISAQGQRLYYLLQRAALDGVLCQGLPRGREPTYVLISEWLGSPQAPAVPNPQAALAERYLLGHGPATVHDFAWWAGWPISVAREAIRAAPSRVRVDVDGMELWAVGEPPPPTETKATAYLLPPFDDYLLGYRDRSQALDPAFARQVNAGGGMPKPTVVVNGAVVGTWARTIRRDRIAVTLSLFRALEDTEQAGVQEAIRRYGEFVGLPVEMP
jgi:hypothetical protein